MSQHKRTGRKTKKTARMPATKFAHLRKRMEKRSCSGKKSG